MTLMIIGSCSSLMMIIGSCSSLMSNSVVTVEDRVGGHHVVFLSHSAIAEKLLAPYTWLSSVH